jgi:hypothetical protein
MLEKTFLKMLRNPKALYTTTEFERTNVIVVERQKNIKMAHGANLKAV